MRSAAQSADVFCARLVGKSWRSFGDPRKNAEAVREAREAQGLAEEARLLAEKL